MNESEEFNKRAAAALHLQGFIAARLGMNPDTTTAKHVELKVCALIDALKKIRDEDYRGNRPQSAITAFNVLKP
jgi:hypothetical protein